MDSRPQDEIIQEPGEAEAESDVEGHSLAATLLVNTIANRNHHPDRSRPSNARGEEALTPLTKKFPRMRDEGRK
jgi:hypothetical protein